MLDAAWQSLVDAVQKQDSDVDASATMASLIQRSELQRAKIDRATTQFNNAVDLYNKAVAQFPANVLAWVFGFKPAHML